MKTLLLMRHGKSSWKNTELDDHDRPLAKRGLRDSRRMGELIRDKELVPQVILSSSSARTLETARILCDVCGSNDRIITLDTLYLAEADVYLKELQKIPDDVERVMVIGHNPGLESLLQMLSGQILPLTTAVVAYMSLPIKSWSELGEKATGELVELWRPKELHELDEEKVAKAEKEKKKKPEKKKAKKKKN
jgi:phosphohistidine phosphatase